MKSKVKVALFLMVMAGFLGLGAISAFAQEKLSDNMQIVLEKVKADKKLLVAANMELTESEAKGFWPVYEEYQNLLLFVTNHSSRIVGGVATPTA